MTRVLLRKYFAESALLWSACAVVLVAFNILRVWSVSLVETEKFKTVIEQFREYERFSPIPFDQMFSYVGRIGVTYDEPIVVMCVVVWVITLGSDVISGELGRGTMEMLLAQPVTRGQILRAHGIVATLGLASLSACVWLGIWIGIQCVSVEETPPQATLYVPIVGINLPLPETPREPVITPMRDLVDASVFGVGALNLFAFGFALLGISTCVSAFDRYRWRAIGLVIGFYICNLILMIASQATDWLEWLSYLTYFSCYKPERIIQYAIQPDNGSPWQLMITSDDGTAQIGPLGMTLVMIAIGCVGYVIAQIRFARRDMPAPV